MKNPATLKTLREENGKSRAEVAAALGVTVSSLGHYERGTREISIEQVLVLAKLYDENAEDIIKAQLNSRQSAL